MKRSTSAKFFIVLAAVFLLGMLLAGCGKKVTEADVSYAGPMLDNVLAGIKDKDYDKFSADFGTQMKTALTKDKFDTLVDMLNTKIGDYVSKSFLIVQSKKSGDTDITAVVYDAKYTKETGDVMITISFDDENGKKAIAGFFLNSPNLQKQ